MKTHIVNRSVPGNSTLLIVPIRPGHGSRQHDSEVRPECDENGCPRVNAHGGQHSVLHRNHDETAADAEEAACKSDDDTGENKGDDIDEFDATGVSGIVQICLNNQVACRLR